MHSECQAELKRLDLKNHILISSDILHTITVFTDSKVNHLTLFIEKKNFSRLM